MNTTQAKQIEFVKVKNDVNGNPRYVCHFLYLNTAAELNASGNEWIPVSEKYEISIKRAKAIGGKKYHTKGFGGGIVFQSYNLDDKVREISRLTGINYTGYTCK